MNTRLVYVALSIIFYGVAGLAQATSHSTTQSVSSQGAQQAVVLTEGEVRKIDKDTGKITIRHGAIVNLGMPPMTMVFEVNDPALLDRVKAGDKIRFAADKVGGAYVVTRLETN